MERDAESSLMTETSKRTEVGPVLMQEDEATMATVLSNVKTTIITETFAPKQVRTAAKS